MFNRNCLKWKFLLQERSVKKVTQRQHKKITATDYKNGDKKNFIVPTTFHFNNKASFNERTMVQGSFINRRKENVYCSSYSGLESSLKGFSHA